MSEAELEKYREHLEKVVAERTKELILSNRRLLQEIEQRNRIEEHLNESYRIIDDMFANLHVLVAYLDAEFNFIRVNNTYAAADGRAPDFFIGRNHFDLYPNEENKALFRRVVETGEPCFIYARPFEYADNPERGTTYWDWTLQPIKDSGGGVRAVVLSLLNVTDKVLAQAETMRAARLASIGELAAGVAHEINNPINGIINYAQILSDKIDSKREKYIAGEIMNEGKRVADIVKALLSFSHARDEEKKEVHVGKVIRDAIHLTGAQMLKEGISLRVDIPKDLPAVTANTQQMEQVFLNLLSNARYALNRKYPGKHEDKVLEISARETNMDDSPHVQMTFHDHGAGIPGGVIDRVVEPFFSTKPHGEGTGLGLSISHGIIAGHNGKLAIESVEGQYARVMISLPAAARES